MPLPAGWANPSYLVCVACLAESHHLCAGKTDPGSCACLCQPPPADDDEGLPPPTDDDEGQ